MMTGTERAARARPGPLTRWWPPLMQFHGNPISRETTRCGLADQVAGNEEARQQFLRGYVPADLELGPRSRTRSSAVATTASGSTRARLAELRTVVTATAPARRSASRSAAGSSTRRAGCGPPCSRHDYECSGASARTAAAARGFDRSSRYVLREVWAREQYAGAASPRPLLVPRTAVHESSTGRTSSISSTAGRRLLDQDG